MKMRRHNLAAREVIVWIRDGAYHHQGTRLPLPQPLCTEEELFPYVEQCFKRLYQPQERMTQIGLSLGSLKGKGGMQYSLFETPKHTEGSENIQQALDTLHTQYGRTSIIRATSLLGEDLSEQRQIYGEI